MVVCSSMRKSSFFTSVLFQHLRSNKRYSTVISYPPRQRVISIHGKSMLFNLIRSSFPLSVYCPFKCLFFFLSLLQGMWATSFEDLKRFSLHISGIELFLSGSQIQMDLWLCPEPNWWLCHTLRLISSHLSHVHNVSNKVAYSII